MILSVKHQWNETLHAFLLCKYCIFVIIDSHVNKRSEN